jgi:hypothetical protein
MFILAVSHLEFRFYDNRDFAYSFTIRFPMHNIDSLICGRYPRNIVLCKILFYNEWLINTMFHLLKPSPNPRFIVYLYLNVVIYIYIVYLYLLFT